MTPETLAHLHALAFRVPRPWSAAEFAALLHTKGVFLLHEADGFLLARLAGPEAEILTLAVHPDARRQGTATRLLAAFMHSAAGRGAQEAFLEVSVENTAAIDLYRKAHFRESGVRRNYYRAAGRENLSALVMRCDIQPDAHP